MNYTKISMEDLLLKLKQDLSEKRYLHSLGTAECAKELAKTYNLDTDKAYIAGLLHDCAKCFSYDKSADIAEKYLKLEQEEETNFKTIHAPVSAFIAETEFGVTDKEILSAIRWHTLGKIEMSDFEKIIFLADKIEPKTRTKDYAEKIRTALNEENGLNKALLVCYKETIKSLINRDLKICTATIEIYNKLEDIINVN